MDDGRNLAAFEEMEAQARQERTALIAALAALVRVCSHGVEDTVEYWDAVGLLKSIDVSPWAR